MSSVYPDGTERKLYETPEDWAFQRSVLQPLVDRRQSMGRGHQKPGIRALADVIGLPKSQISRMELLAEADEPVGTQKTVNLHALNAWARSLGLVPAVAYDRTGNTFFRSLITYAQALTDPEARDLALRFMRVVGRAPLQVVRSSVEYLEALAATGDAEAVRRQG